MSDLFVVSTTKYKIICKPKLGKLLAEKGYTQLQFAELVGIPQANISRFDRVTQHKDAYEFLIAHVLGRKIEDLYDVKIIKKDDKG